MVKPFIAYKYCHDYTCKYDVCTPRLLCRHYLDSVKNIQSGVAPEKRKLFFKMFCFIRPQNVPSDSIENAFMFEQVRGGHHAPTPTHWWVCILWLYLYILHIAKYFLYSSFNSMHPNTVPPAFKVKML